MKKHAQSAEMMKRDYNHGGRIMKKRAQSAEMMKKDVIYSMRMSSMQRDLLNTAAKDRYRTVASLLDTIIMEYLDRNGYLEQHILERERRKSRRKEMNIPAVILQFGADREPEHFPCVVQDLSATGILINIPKNKNFKILFTGEIPVFQINFFLPDVMEMVRVDCSLRNIREFNEHLQLGCNLELDKKDAQKFI